MLGRDKGMPYCMQRDVLVPGDFTNGSRKFRSILFSEDGSEYE